MKEENKSEIVAKVATVSNIGVNKVSTDVASLLVSIADREIRDRQKREYIRHMKKLEPIFNMPLEQIEAYQDQGWIFTEIGTIESASRFQGHQYRVYEAKMVMRIKIMKASEKLKERILELGISCNVYFQIYEDESVSILINPESENVSPELYKYGECNGFIVHSAHIECSRDDFKKYNIYDLAGIVDDLKSVFEDFKIVSDPTFDPNFKLHQYDDEGNRIESNTLDDLPF